MPLNTPSLGLRNLGHFQGEGVILPLMVSDKSLGVLASSPAKTIVRLYEWKFKEWTRHNSWRRRS